MKNLLNKLSALFTLALVAVVAVGSNTAHAVLASDLGAATAITAAGIDTEVFAVGATLIAIAIAILVFRKVKSVIG